MHPFTPSSDGIKQKCTIPGRKSAKSCKYTNKSRAEPNFIWILPSGSILYGVKYTIFRSRLKLLGVETALNFHQNGPRTPEAKPPAFICLLSEGQIKSESVSRSTDIQSKLVGLSTGIISGRSPFCA